MKSKSAAVLIIANLLLLLLPLIGEFNPFDSIWVYYLESFAIVLWGIPRILLCRGDLRWGYKIFSLIVAPVIYFGGLAILGLGLARIYADTVLPPVYGDRPLADLSKLLNNLPRSRVLLGAALFILSHGYSFVQNFLRGMERLRMTTTQAVELPMIRVQVLFFTLFVSMACLVLVESRPHDPAIPLKMPWFVGVLIVLVKTSLDYVLHLKIHKKLAESGH